MLSPEVNLETHIHDVVNLILWEDLTDVVLCGHSYGGCVVTGAADRLQDRVAALVYLDAFVPEDGKALFDYLPAGQREAMRAGAAEGWKVPPIPAEAFRVNSADAAWVNHQCTPQPVGTFDQPVRLAGAVGGIKNVTYILAEGFREGSPFRQFYDRAQASGWKTVTVPCGHDVMLDMPEELTRILAEAAPRAAAASS
jgi:pimeloyl-ACP methyl ester carboxylesterase